MNLQEIYNAIDEQYPFDLSDEYCEMFKGYDNSGILIDCGTEIEKVLFSLDLSQKAVDEAVKRGAGCIVTHHPAIYTPLKKLSMYDGSAGVLKAAMNGISVISAHLNLDVAENGIDVNLMRGLGGVNPVVMHEISEGGYGRSYGVVTDSMTLIDRIRRIFRTDRVLFYGKPRKLSRIASFCGGGLDSAALEFAQAQKVHAIVSSDAPHHIVAEAVERGFNVFLIPHYAAEAYGFSKFHEKMKETLEVPCDLFIDGRMM